MANNRPLCACSTRTVLCASLPDRQCFWRPLTAV